jgi:short-subunit dehydrogenase
MKPGGSRQMSNHVVVITGPGTGIGRATAREFARKGCDVGLIGRNRERLEAAAKEVRAFGARATVALADVADSEAIEAAADQIEAVLGPITVWVNNAMATVFSPVAELDAAELRRATEVTYLGAAYGTMAALRRMRRRGSGAIINVGSALSYRSLPLQSALCGAKAAIRGFTDSLRSEILHDGDRIQLTMVHLPAINTPVYGWALNRTGKKIKPLRPVFEPEIAARAIVFAAFHPRRDVWVGFSTLRAILAGRIVAGLADRALAGTGYWKQLDKKAVDPNAPHNLFEAVPGSYAVAGAFEEGSRKSSLARFTSRHWTGLLAAGAAAAATSAFRARRPRS